MKVAEVVLVAVTGWCGVGVAGVAISMMRGRRAEARKHTGWIAAVAGVYLLALLGVSVLQRRTVVAIGQAQCFGAMCFTVTGMDEVPGLVEGDDGRVVRVMVRVANRGDAAADAGSIAAHLVDSRGREWGALAGLSGNRLTQRVAGGSTMVSEPMFRVAKDAAEIGVVFTHGSWQWRRLLIGDSESLGHRRTVVGLGR